MPMLVISRPLLTTGLALAALASATMTRAETLDQLYEKAKLEKSLVFYAGGPAAPHENRVKEFQQRFPGIAVSITGGFSNVLNAKINQQIREG
jgi:UDP-N-acetyl-D-mannosaminuronic acid transferase (WecB/TagA/CpsF family)